MESKARRREQSRPVGAEVRHEADQRRQLSGPALRTFFNIAAAWHLTVEQQRALLGWPAASTFHKYKAATMAR